MFRSVVAWNRLGSLTSFEIDLDCKSVPPSWELGAITIELTELNLSKPKNDCLDSSSLSYIANASIFPSPLNANRTSSVQESFVKKNAIEMIAIATKKLALKQSN